jgi:CHAT domain-containing protein
LGDQVELIVSEESKQEIQDLKTQVEANKTTTSETIQNLQTQLEREQNKNNFLEEQLEQQTQIIQPNPPAFEK